MHISIDTSEPLSDTDKAILTALTGGVVVATAPKEGTKTPAPAKKAAAAPAKDPVVEPDPEPEPAEDLVGDDEPTVTLADLKALASKVVAAGDAAKVKAALTAVKAGKISEVNEADIAGVYAALSE